MHKNLHIFQCAGFIKINLNKGKLKNNMELGIGSKYKKKQILIIAPEFPPQISIGRIRPTKFAKHLREYGWHSSVITAKVNKSLPIDMDLKKEIPEYVKVYPTTYPKIIDGMIGLAKKIYPKGKKGKPKGKYLYTYPDEKLKGRPKLGPETVIKEFISSMAQVLKKISYRYLLIPDNWILWIPGAYIKSLFLQKKNKFLVVFTTAPPLSSFLVGFLIKKTYGIPWVCDYRDLWSDDVLRDWVPSYRKKLEKWLEKKIVANADRIITVSRQKVTFLKKLHPAVEPKKFIYIPNGFDEDEYSFLDKSLPPPSQVLTFVYTGRFFKNRKPYLLLKALGKIKNENPHFLKGVKFEFFGDIEQKIKKKINNINNKYAIDEYLTFINYVPYKESKKKQLQANILLLFVDTGSTSNGVLPGKLFEYMAAKKPILGIMPNGDASQIIKKGKLGWCINPEDLTELIQVIKNIIQLHRDNKLSFNPSKEFVDKFNRIKLTQKLSVILENVK